jgi:hypothetical protein
MLRHSLFLLLALFAVSKAKAQKPFTEGVIIYNITADEKPVTGTITYTVKGSFIKKEIKMSNGYQDVLIFNYVKNTVYSLKIAGDKKYAIQLDYEEYLAKQKPFEDFKIEEEKGTMPLCGIDAQKATVHYKDGKDMTIYYSAEWMPVDAIMFQHFPGIKVLPLFFSHPTSTGVIMTFKAQKISAEPVENAAFNIPSDYKIISNEEYKQLQK